MSATEPPPLSLARFTAAARSIWALAAMDAVHISVVLCFAPADKLASNGPEGIVAAIVLNLALIGGMAWLGFRVRDGRNVAGACAAIALFGFLLLGVVGAIAGSGGYQGVWPQASAQIALGLTWLVALTYLFRAWIAR